MPQIEVTDIDVNGIVKVSAKDLGTGKAQEITLTARTGLSDEDINRLVKEAEAHAEEDQRRKELIDARNEADGLIYSVDRTLKELGDKVTDQERAEIVEAQEALKAVMGGEDIQAIKEKQEALSAALYKVTSRVYQATQTSQSNEASDGQTGGKTVDADFTVDDHNEK